MRWKRSGRTRWTNIVKPVDEERLARTLRHVRETSLRRSGSGGGDLFIRCFGKLEIVCGGNIVRLPTKKTRELFAYLLCSDGTPIYRDGLMRFVFGTGDAGKDANNLRVSLFRIRNAFQEARVGKNQLLLREDLSLEIADGVCDIVDFWRFIKNNLTITADNIAQAEKVAGFINGGLFDDIDALWITEKREWVSAQIEEILVAMSIFYLSGGFKEQAEAARRFCNGLVMAGG